jgi:hypothetical protein
MHVNYFGYCTSGTGMWRRAVWFLRLVSFLASSSTLKITPRVPSKRRLTLNGLHDIISQKIETLHNHRVHNLKPNDVTRNLWFSYLGWDMTPYSLICLFSMGPSISVIRTGCDSVYSNRMLPTFHRSLLPPSSGLYMTPYIPLKCYDYFEGIKLPTSSGCHCVIQWIATSVSEELTDFAFRMRCDIV